MMAMALSPPTIVPLSFSFGPGGLLFTFDGRVFDGFRLVGLLFTFDDFRLVGRIFTFFFNFKGAKISLIGARIDSFDSDSRDWAFCRSGILICGISNRGLAAGAEMRDTAGVTFFLSMKRKYTTTINTRASPITIYVFARLFFFSGIEKYYSNV